MLCGREWLREKYGIEADQYAAFKSLTGDAADNIRGIPGVGPKTAAALLRQFGSLETLLEQAQSIERAAIREAVLQNRERLRLNHLLICLRAGETLPFTKAEIAWQDPGYSSTQVLKLTGLRI